MNYTIVDYFGYPLSAQERMKTIKQAGFDGVILLWADYFDGDYKDFPKYAEKEGLYVENAHAPYMQANTIWDDTITGEEYTDHIVRCIEDCSVFHIPTLVMHPINGMVPLPKGNVGIDRLKKSWKPRKNGISISRLKIRAIPNTSISCFEIFHPVDSIFVLTAVTKDFILHSLICWICMEIDSSLCICTTTTDRKILMRCLSRAMFSGTG